MPLGDQVALTEGTRLKPLSSWKQIQAFRLRAFFYPRPVLGHPALDGPLVALGSAPGWALAAPADLVEDLPDVAGMIRHPGRGLYDLAHPGQGPQVSRVTVGGGPLGQFFSDTAELGGVQLGQPPSPPGAGQASRPLRLPVGVPAAHALTADFQLPRHVRLGLALGEQLGGLFAALFEASEVSTGP